MRTFSLTVRVGKRPFDCGTCAIPALVISADVSWSMRCPSTRMEPPMISSSPLTARNTVDLPAPLGPTMQAIVPRSTLRLTPRSTAPPP